MDDFKIIYKILKELEKNMGNENFKIETISAEKMGTAFNYSFKMKDILKAWYYPTTLKRCIAI